MERSNCRGVSFIEILLTMAIIAVLGTIIYSVFNGADKAQLTRCYLTLGEMTAASKKHDQVKAGDDTNTTGEACQKLNKLIDKYKEEQCENLTMVKADNKCR